MAALACYKTGERSRLIYRPRIQGHHKGDHRGFTWQDYRNLIVRAHLQLGGPIVVIWDNLNVHRSAASQQWAAGQDRLTIIQLPSYAPDLNPVEGHLVPATTCHHSQCRLHQPRPSRPCRPQRHTPHPTQTPPHRRLPDRHRPTTPPDTTKPDTPSERSVIRGSCPPINRLGGEARYCKPR
ncbi:transposase [Streptomyces sp. NBRC 110611]|nr:transposase [Streptomyces sp. NBRC 110611]